MKANIGHSDPSAKKQGATILGVGAAACAACCAGPILGFLAAIGLGTAAGFDLFGTIGLITALAVGAAFSIRRRRRRSTCAPTEITVSIGSPPVRVSR